MITDMKPRGMVGNGGQVARWLLVLPVLAAAWLGACDSVPLTAPSGTTIRLFTNAQMLPLNGTAEITASVLEAGGNPVQNGTVVTFTASLGTISPADAKTTDGGRVTVVFNAGSQSGTAVINAFSGLSSTSGGTTTTTGTTATTTAGTAVSIVIGAAAAKTVTVTASPSTVSQLGGTSSITAVVVDSNNNGLPSVPVTFSTDQGSLSQVAVLTNSSGIATSVLTTTQPASVTASVGALTSTVKIATTLAPTMTITLPASTSTPTVGLATPLSVTVTPGTLGNSVQSPIRNVTVDFGDGTTANLGGASGTFSVQHVYLTPGTFTVSGFAIDSAGQTASVSVPLVVFPAVPFTMTVNAATGRVGIPVTMTALPNAGAPAIISFTWDFGDGTPPVTTIVGTVSHIYTSIPGGFTSFPFVVTVTAVGADSRTGIGSTSTTITQ
jgi:hypothetical protein